MNIELTLLLDKKLFKASKKYAKKKGTSLKKLIENFLSNLEKEPKKSEREITPIFKSFSREFRFTQKKGPDCIVPIKRKRSEK